MQTKEKKDSAKKINGGYEEKSQTSRRADGGDEDLTEEVTEELDDCLSGDRRSAGVYSWRRSRSLGSLWVLVVSHI